MIGLHEDVLEMFSHLEGCADDEATLTLWNESLRDPHAAADKWIAATEEQRIALRAQAEAKHQRVIAEGASIRFGSADFNEYRRKYRLDHLEAERTRCRDYMRARRAKSKAA